MLLLLDLAAVSLLSGVFGFYVGGPPLFLATSAVLWAMAVIAALRTLR